MNMKLPKRPSLAEERELISIIQGDGTKEEKEVAKTKLVEGHLYLIRSVIAKVYRNIPVDTKADLFQEGVFGLHVAVDKYETGKGTRFATYAHFWIRQKVNQYLSDTSRTIRKPAYIIDAINKITKARNEFFAEHNRDATDEEVSNLTGIPLEKMHTYENAMQQTASLEFDIGEDSTLSDVIEDTNVEDPENAYIRQDLNQRLSDILVRILEPREERIVRLRLGIGSVEPHTLEDIGIKMSLTKERVRQIEKKAFEKLKKSDILRVFKEENFDL